MKYAIVVCLFSASSLISMKPDDNKTITVFNNTKEDINVNFNYFFKANNQFAGLCNISENNIAPYSKKTFKLEDDQRTFVPTIDLFNAVPRRIQLNISEDGAIQYGNTIKVSENKKTFIISHNGIVLATTPSIHKTVKLGGLPKDPLTNLFFKQVLTIVNKDLSLVSVSVIGKCLPPSSQPVSSLINREKCARYDKQVAKTNVSLRENESHSITNFSPEEYPRLLETVIKLTIAQAMQKVRLYISDKHIQSGSTIELSLSSDKKRILVTKLMHGQSSELLTELLTDVLEKITIG